MGSSVAAMVAAGNKLFNKLGVEELVLASLKSERCRVSHKQCGVVDDGGLCANWKLLLVGANVIEVSYGEGVVFHSLLLKLYLFYFVNFKIRKYIVVIFNRHYS